MAESRASARELVLLASVFAVAVAGLVYELIAGTLSTYLLGGSITVFSVVIGLFLSAMGLGAWLAQFVRTELARAFIVAELALAAVGGGSALILFAAFAWVGDGYPFVLAALCITTGALVGVEIPLLLRILEQRTDLRVAVSQVLALDYVGALIGSVSFPLLLLPWLGLVRSSAFVGLLNVAVAALALVLLKEDVPRRGPLGVVAGGIGLLLAVVMATGAQSTTWLEDQLYEDAVVFAQDTPYQRVVLTRWRNDTRLYLDGHLQFSTQDEYRYHEALVHPAMLAARRAERVLILGGGDGLGVQRALLHPGVRRVDLVDLDPAITDLFTNHPTLSAVNGGALSDPRVVVHHADAVRFLELATDRWDVILMDLPDPHDAGLARLYAASTFKLALRRLSEGGALATQATSPFHAPEAFWCIVTTLEHAAERSPRPWQVRPGVVEVPSFGTWGMVLVTSPGADFARDRLAELPTRWLNEAALQQMWGLPADLERREVEVNRLGSARLASYYRTGWRRWQ